uniref:Uncharacterized protein n=1 Tax=Meloidogyne enterolobii TaxID=390850 RepID=A0A6V7UCG9_MELEN|nr:unnamed protein product [Meloidogyne enterolobii]
MNYLIYLIIETNENEVINFHLKLICFTNDCILRFLPKNIKRFIIIQKKIF